MFRYSDIWNTIFICEYLCEQHEETKKGSEKKLHLLLDLLLFQDIKIASIINLYNIMIAWAQWSTLNTKLGTFCDSFSFLSFYCCELFFDELDQVVPDLFESHTFCVNTFLP